MALPRYNQASIAPQVGSEGQQAIAQEMSGFASRLQSWNDAAYGVLKEQAIEEGRDTAVKDLVSGDPARLEKGYTFYAKAYNDVSKAAFNVSTESDIKTSAETIAMESQGDPDKFNAMFQAYSKTIIGNIQEPEFKAIAMQTAQKVQGTKYNSLLKDRFENSRKKELDAIDAGIKDQSSEYFASITNGDEVSAVESLAKITSLWEAQVKAGAMSEDMIPLKLKTLQKEAYAKTEIFKFRQAVDKGATASSLIELSNKDHSAFLNPEEATALRKEATSIIKQRNELVAEAVKVDEQASLIDEVTTKRALVSKFADNTLTEEELLSLFSQGNITAKTYNEMGDLLSSGTNRFGDEKIFNEMLPLALSGRLSNEKIMYNPKLSQKQISTLLKTNQQQKDENTRQAIERAKANGGTIDAAREHISLTKEAETLISKSFPIGRSKSAMIKTKNTINKLNAKLIELRNTAIVEGKSSAWVYQETLKMIDDEKKAIDEETKRENEALKKLQKPKPLSFNGNVTGVDVFYSRLVGSGEENA